MTDKKADNRYITLGQTGLRICRVGFGGIPIQRLAPADSDTVISAAVDGGINFFDTSRIYTDSESKLGRVLPAHRDQVIIASKTYSRDGAGARKDLETSLRELRTQRVDIYQLHNIGSESELDRVLAPGGALEALDQARQQGLVRYIGITGHKPWIVLKALEAYPFATVQVPVNIIEQSSLDALIPAACERGIGVIAMKPVAGGALREVGLNLRFILTSGVDVAIPGMDSPEQVTQNLKSLEGLSPLNPEEMARLEAERECLGDHFCRRCEYCMPCPEGLNIPFLHLVEGYYFRYDLKEWAWERLQSMEKSYADCTACGQCVSRCPYELDMPNLFRDAWKRILADRKSLQS